MLHLPNKHDRTFTKLELVQNGCFTGSIETNHQDTHLFLAKLQSKTFLEKGM